MNDLRLDRHHSFREAELRVTCIAHRWTVLAASLLRTSSPGRMNPDRDRHSLVGVFLLDQLRHHLTPPGQLAVRLVDRLHLVHGTDRVISEVIHKHRRGHISFKRQITARSSA